MTHPTSILITGASSGIGAALAREYALPGVTLFLSARNQTRLDAVAETCRTLGADVHTAQVDITDKDDTRAWLLACDAIKPVEVIIANAGISAGTGGAEGDIHSESIEQVELVFKTNIDGVINTVLPLLPAMITRKKGHIGIVSSLAGFRGLPSAPAYSASKAAVRVYAEGLRGHVRRHGVTVTAICPGYIRTPMTEINPYPMPFLMDADRAAAIIAHGVNSGKSRVAFPFGLYFPVWLLSCLSPRLTDAFFARLPGKPGLANNM